MACFIVPTAEAIVMTAVTQIVIAKERQKKPETLKVSVNGGAIEERTKTPFSKKLKWLTNLLWGGSILLAFEHLWHGEVVPWFPFLTATVSKSDTVTMLHEMATVGVSMAALVTVVWCGMLIVSSVIEKRAEKQLSPLKEN